MYSPDDIKDAMDRAIHARRNKDFETAITEAEVALGMLGAVADAKKGGFAGAELAWDRNAIVSFIDQIRRSQRAATTKNAGGFQVAKIRYVSNSCTESEDYP